MMEDTTLIVIIIIIAVAYVPSSYIQLAFGATKPKTSALVGEYGAISEQI